MRAVIDAVHPATRRTRSDLEVDFLKLCRRFDIEAPVENATVAGYEVLPVSDEWLNSDPREVAEAVIALLAQSGNTGGLIASSL